MACDACGRPIFSDHIEDVPKDDGCLFVCEPCRKDAARRFSRLYAAGYLRSYWRAPTLFRMMREWDERPHIVTPGGMGIYLTRQDLV